MYTAITSEYIFFVSHIPPSPNDARGYRLVGERDGVKGLYYLRVREAVGRGKEDGKSGGWVASCFWGGGRG